MYYDNRLPHFVNAYRMTCPEMIDVMATEHLWVSPGGKTPASTLYAALARSIKDEGKASAFRKVERGKFEAKI